MLRPDYERSIVNLMASIADGLGAPPTGYAPLPELPAGEMRERTVVLMVIDGLGDEWLARRPQSCLTYHRVSRLTSIFPTTTAAAITTFTTGVAPQQHAITGWFMHLRELGSVAAILPFRPRHGGPSYADAGVSPEQIIAAPPLASAVPGRTAHLSPSYIIDSPFSRAIAGDADRHGYDDLAGFFGELARLIQEERHRYIFAYWPELDAVSHQHGSYSTEAARLFDTFDAAFERFLRKTAGTGTRLIATADHGHIDTDERHSIDLEQHPRLVDELLLPLCGDPRSPFCYVRHGRRKAFRAYVEGELSDYCEAVSSAELIAEGYFGQGAPAAELANRVGDYVLMTRGNAIIRDRLITERPFKLRGVHGGLSAEELFVPLIVAQG